MFVSSKGNLFATVVALQKSMKTQMVGLWEDKWLIATHANKKQILQRESYSLMAVPRNNVETQALVGDPSPERAKN